MSLAAVGTAVAGAAAGSLISSALAPDQSGKAASAADPFAGQRGQYQTLLNQMMGIGGAGFTPNDPSYKFRYDQGMDAVNRGSAASGMLNSGNRLLALENYGQGAASTEYANQFSRLSQLAGANVGSPAAAGQIIQNQNTANQQSASAFGNQISTAIKGGSYGGGSGSTGFDYSSSGASGYVPGASLTSGGTDFASSGGMSYSY